jgi:hypothetical protein
MHSSYAYLTSTCADAQREGLRRVTLTERVRERAMAHARRPRYVMSFLAHSIIKLFIIIFIS